MKRTPSKRPSIVTNAIYSRFVNHQETKPIITWGVNFVTRNEMQSFPALNRISEEQQKGQHYHFSGSSRNEKHVIFQYTLSGEGYLTNHRSQINKHSLGPGACFLCCADDPACSYGYPINGDQPWHLLYANFTGQMTRELVTSFNRTHGYVFHLNQTHRLVQRLLDWRQKNASTIVVEPTYGLQVLTDIFQSCIESLPTETKANHIHTAIRLMEQHLSTPLALADIATQLGVSREYLSRIFQDELATTPGKQYMHMRLQRACEVMTTTGHSLDAVALQHGFADATHFGKAFKRHFGLTPGQWRNRNCD